MSCEEKTGSDLTKKEDGYHSWIRRICARYSQIRESAAENGNSEIIRFCWSLGRDLDQQISLQTYEWSFFQQTGEDIKEAFPDIAFFSPRNLFFMHRFYKLFPGQFIFFPKHGPGETTEKAEPADPQFYETMKTPLSGTSPSAEEFNVITWDDLASILSKCGTDRDKVLFYIRKTVEYNWPGPVLAFFLATDYYEWLQQPKESADFEPSLKIQRDETQVITGGESVPELSPEKELRNVPLIPVGHFKELPGGDWTDSSFYESFCGSVLDHLYQESPENVEKIVAYLDQGLPLINNRLCFGDDPLAPDGRGVYYGPEYTDGIWLWPEYLSYYVEHYQLKLPTAFVETMRINAWEVPASFEVLGVDSLEIGEKTFCGKCGEKMLIIRDPLWSGMTCPSCGWGWKKLSSELENTDVGRDHLLYTKVAD